jgi:hypothetical protein
LMVKDGCYNNWLSNKRSNLYQAVQNYSWVSSFAYV